MDELKKLGNKVKASLVKPDGSLNGKIVAALLSLVIVAAQEVAACFGLKLTGDLGSIQALINTLLTIFGLIGVISDPTPVALNETKAEDKSQDNK